jgi:hypothetical protein
MTKCVSKDIVHGVKRNIEWRKRTIHGIQRIALALHGDRILGLENSESRREARRAHVIVREEVTHTQEILHGGVNICVIKQSSSLS